MAPFLRDGPTSAVHLNEADLQSQLDVSIRNGERREQTRLCGLIAEVHRANGADARPWAEQAVRLATELGDRHAIRLNRIRLATARFYLDEHERAEVMLRSTVSEIQASDDDTYLDFAYQHLGKCLAEQSRFDEAIACFAEALDRRSDPALRASSQHAIDTAKGLAAGRTLD